MVNQTQEELLSSNKKSWDQVAPKFFGRTALPMYGPFAPTEDDLNLFGDVSRLKVLEIGCGSGHSLAYMASRGAAELWGLDLSDTQITAARGLLADHEPSLNLFQGPMETNPGLPQAYLFLAGSIRCTTGSSMRTRLLS
ncbi:class I SAM-dependent methyltransferase [Paenibacillus pinihumi]|uniref:class I SAM-dependent methyltransferase n=1 Tax=Paenibacillus pinihumi TaxID=669462 RepID=UPI000402DC91|nr:class I SAM-dependent methyltransferase [Paenibacillus pinihumi]